VSCCLFLFRTFRSLCTVLWLNLAGVMRTSALPAFAERLVAFVSQASEVSSFDHCVVDRGELVGTVLNMYAAPHPFFELCIGKLTDFLDAVPRTSKAAPVLFGTVVDMMFSDHLPIELTWTF
jgi:hypothetical protein